MNKVIVSFLLVSFFACKKENNEAVNISQVIDSNVNYNEWVKMNKVPYNFFDPINDLSFQTDKNMAFLSGLNLSILDSSFNLKTLQVFSANTPNVYKKFQNHNGLTEGKNRFFFFLKPVSENKENSQLIIENNIEAKEINTQIYNRSYFIKDSNFTNIYSYLGFGEDYFAYYIYDTIPSSFKHQLNYYNHKKQINNTVEFYSNVIFDEAFKINNQVIFWKHANNEYATVNINSMEVQVNQSVLKEYKFIGTFNNYAYFYNYKANGIFKTNDFIEFKIVYQNELLYMPMPYFNNKYLLAIKNKSNQDVSNKEFIIIDLENSETHNISIPFTSDESFKCNWIINNTLYILTTNYIYARKF